MPDEHAPQVLVAGGGLTGLSAALHLRRPYLLLERDATLGGLARTEARDGFYFDATGHWLHLRDPGMEKLARELLGESLLSVERRARIFSAGTLIPYPFQANVHALPREEAYECLLGYVRSLLSRGSTGSGEPRNFEDYILHHFGEGIARHFMIPYNSKLWGVHPREITSAWCSRFVPVPTMEQMLAGAIGAGSQQLGYNVRFVYPRQGGIGTLSSALAARIDPQRVRTGCSVEEVDARRRTVRAGGETMAYEALVSTLPLPELVARLVDPPARVVEAAGRLRATAVRYLNVAVRAQPPESYHWVYVPEERLPFYRVGVFSNAAPRMAPSGCSNLYVELSGRGAIDVGDAVRALAEIRAISSAADVLFADLREIPCAYVIFDESYEQALADIFPYLELHRIYSCGRYGSWIYNAMEDSLLAGRDVAARIDALPAARAAALEGVER
jgi:protoporphyrinogen oxidase